MLGATYRFVARQRAVSSRAISSLSSNPSIKVVKSPKAPFTNYLSYLDKEPPNERLSFSENREFVKILDEVVSEYGHQDEDLINQARAFASPGGFNLGSGGVFFPQKRPDRSGSRKQGARGAAGGDGAGGASAQGGAGGAWPEDILGSVEVDDAGTIIGKVQPSGTYRILTNEGILGLSPFLQGKLVERLKQEAAKRE
ncbi:hypothetical protein NXS19_003533 [Fusarium pseudograminearum]|nr:hypothetical protein NXS19_003533 [Fusarium pseudograminearum]